MKTLRPLGTLVSMRCGHRSRSFARPASGARRGIVALIVAVTSTSVQSQTVATVMAGRTVADVGYYGDDGAVLTSNGERHGATVGLGVRFRADRRLSAQSELRVVARGDVSGTSWMNSTYVDGALTGDVSFRRASRVLRPYLALGFSVGMLAACARGAETSSGPHRDSCGEEGIAFPRVSRWHVGREVAFGLRIRTPPRDVDLELSHSRSLRSFENHSTGLDAYHRVWAFRVRACVVSCRP